MSNLRDDQFLFERLQDECPEVDDLNLRRILETLESEGVSVSKSSSVSKRLREQPEEFRCTRASAVSALRKLDASRDRQVIEIRRISESLREKALATILDRAMVSGTFKEPARQRPSASLVIRLPGVLQEKPYESLFLPLSVFEDIDPRLLAFFERITRIASRISDDYCIHPDHALIYLLLDKGFRSKPHVAWSIASREDRPGLTRINMSIDPWSSPEEVAAEYAKARASSGHAGLRAQRDRTYLLAHRFATEVLVGLIDRDRPDWRFMMMLWTGFCQENLVIEFAKWPFENKDVYQFARDVRHAVKTLSDTTDHRVTKAKQPTIKPTK